MGVLPVVSPETKIKQDEDGIMSVFYHGERMCALGQRIALDDIWVRPEPGYQIGRCKLIKENGERCKNGVRPGNNVCHHHGAGYSANPGGRTVQSGRYSKFLPTRLVNDYEELLNDPDFLSMRSELALIDARISEQLLRLENIDGARAWEQVKMAARIGERMLDMEAIPIDDIEKLVATMNKAVTMKCSDDEI